MRGHSIHCCGYRPALEPFDETKCDCGYLAEQYDLAQQRITALEAVANWALSVEKENTDEWMRGMRAQFNGLMVRDGDTRRCGYNGQRLFLHDVPDNEAADENAISETQD